VKFVPSEPLHRKPQRPGFVWLVQKALIRVCLGKLLARNVKLEL